MTEKTQQTSTPDSASDLRSQLVKRLAVAGILVAILLGMLAFFDYLATPPEEAEEPVFTQPVPVAPKKEVSQPLTPTDKLPEPPPAAEAPPAPEAAAQPAAAAESRPAEPKAEILQPAAKDSRPAARSAAAPVPPLERPAVPPAARVPAPVPESTASPAMAPRQEVEAAPAARPSARVVEVKPAPAVATPSAPRLFSGFVLQAGVFLNTKSAEELHAKLTLSGVPSTLETRVQVGPFRTRQEAEAAQAKLKAMGVETILVPPKGSKR